MDNVVDVRANFWNSTCFRQNHVYVLFLRIITLVYLTLLFLRRGCLLWSRSIIEHELSWLCLLVLLLILGLCGRGCPCLRSVLFLTRLFIVWSKSCSHQTVDPLFSVVQLLHDSIALLVILVVVDQIAENDIQPGNCQEHDEHALVGVAWISVE